MAFGFLCDPVKKIFSIGFKIEEQKLDPGYYDLLASEARLASFVAIAKGDVPALHWFHLSRSLAVIPEGLTLMSWSGSMFEYLMPSLVMQPPVGSLLDQTCRYRGSPPDLLTPRSAMSPGASPNPGTTRRMWSSRIKVQQLRRAGLGTQARPGRESLDRQKRLRDARGHGGRGMPPR